MRQHEPDDRLLYSWTVYERETILDLASDQLNVSAVVYEETTSFSERIQCQIEGAMSTTTSFECGALDRHHSVQVKDHNVLFYH